MKHLPKWVRGAVIFRIGVLLLALSLFASTPPTYLATIGLGSGALVLGVFCFLIFMFYEVKTRNPEL